MAAQLEAGGLQTPDTKSQLPISSQDVQAVAIKAAKFSM
jgi:hypothetical protein